MRELSRNLTAKPTTIRDELQVMKRAEDAQKSALGCQAAYLQNSDERDFRLALLFHAEAQTLWAQALFYGTVS